MAPSPPSPIRILIVDDHAVMRMGLRLLLEGQPDLLVVGEAATGAEALTAATGVPPDVIVLDLDLGGESAIDILPALCTAAPRARVLILTGVRDPDLHRQAVRCGARGLIRKETAAGVLLQAIRKVQAGEGWLERTMMATILDEIQSASMAPPRDPETAKIATLTARERDVIARIGEGLKNRDIARHLRISETTVRHYLTVIFAKLEVTDRLELAVYAYHHGLV